MGLFSHSQMNELEILRVVKSERKPYWGGRSDFKIDDLRRALGVADSNRSFLSDSFFSNLLLAKPIVDEDRFLRLIEGSGYDQTKARKAVEDCLRLSGLFSCTNRAQVIELISRLDGVTLPKAKFHVVGIAPAGDFGITSAEKYAADYLKKAILTFKTPCFHWNVTFNSGASILASNMLVHLGPQSPFSKIVVVRPSDFALPFEAEIAKLSGYLEAAGYRVGPKRLLADAIIAGHVLLVVLSPFVLDTVKDDNSMRSLIKEFLTRRDHWTDPSNILVVGESQWMLKQANNEPDIHSKKLMQLLRFRGEGRFAEFREQWKRFSGLREQVLSEESGSRMRRAATYYRVQNSKHVWPVSIKLRALFASNNGSASYFDPTQGFERLGGPRFAEFEDINSYYQDVSDYLGFVRYLDKTAKGGSLGKKMHYYLLQYASTAKHWLTEEALEVLIDKIEGERKNKLSLTTEKARMLALSPTITEKSEVVSDAKKSRYFASIAVKAIVQDDWINSDPYTRSLAHYRIAERLKSNENNKELLEREFPYEPHWGRSRIFSIRVNPASSAFFRNFCWEPRQKFNLFRNGFPKRTSSRRQRYQPSADHKLLLRGSLQEGTQWKDRSIAR